MNWIYLLVFVSGSVVLALEILGARLISPFYGSTLYVWSSMITVTLASLAAGYALGGVLADLPPPRKSRSGPALMWLGRVLGGAGFWLVFLPFLRRPVLMGTSSLGPQLGSLVGAGVLLGVPLLFLGAVGPLAIRLRTEELSHLGRRVGAVSAVSTAGSVAGALAAGFWLVPRASVSWVLCGIAATVAALSALCLVLTGAKRDRLLAALLVAAWAAGAGWLALRPGEGAQRERMRERVNSFYGAIRVVDMPERDRRILTIDGIPNTIASLSDLDSLSDYITSFELLPFLRPKARRALLIGLGGGSLVGRYDRHYGIETDVVEIDPEMERLARRWFGFKPTGEVHVTDGRMFLRDAPEGSAYDLIVVDAFNGDQHPYHLFSLEAFELTARRLRPDGVLAMNMIGYAAGPRARLLRSVHRTLGEVFEHVRVLNASRSADPRTDYLNLIFLASQSPLGFRRDPAEGRPHLAEYYEDVRHNFLPAPQGGTLITDDLNPIEDMSARAFVKIRRNLLRSSRWVLVD